MKKKWIKPSIEIIPCRLSEFTDTKGMSDTELKLKMEKLGYKFTKTFQVKDNYIHRKVAGTDVLIPICENVANFNGYIELNKSASYLWDQMKEPCTCQQMEQCLETAFAIPHEQAVEDVLDFIKVLKENDMVIVQ